MIEVLLEFMRHVHLTVGKNACLLSSKYFYL